MTGYPRTTRLHRPRPVVVAASTPPTSRFRLVGCFGAVAAGMLLLAGCSITPISEVQQPPPVETAPPALALVEPGGTNDDGEASNDSVTENSGVRAQTESDALVRNGASAAFFVDTTSARIGVHSAPGYAFTRLGVLGPGDGLISTGRSVEASDAMWLEVHWVETTAWVADAGLTRIE
ncbi:MAG: hypothetical protein ACR2PK_06410 [Acidimicrobiales bacterium]